MRSFRLIWQLYWSTLIVVVIALAIVTVHASESVSSFYQLQTRNSLWAQAHVLDLTLEGFGQQVSRAELDDLAKHLGEASHTRFTVVLPSGEPIADSEAQPENMENHSDRREIQDAWANGTGWRMRKSPTLNVDMMYCALRGRALINGQPVVIRAAMSLKDMDVAISTLQFKVGIMALATAFATALVMNLIARRIARPLEKVRHGIKQLSSGDLAHRLRVSASPEMSELADLINNLAAQLQERIQTVTQQRNEQDAVFASMGEGVIAVDIQERLLRMNRAAAEFLNVDARLSEGKAIQEVVRNSELQSFVSSALSISGPSEGEVILRDGAERYFALRSTPLNNAGGIKIGTLIVLNDLTRIRRLEGFRRDFVANVSHELKTPITCIKGFVETLIEGAIDDSEAARKFLDIIARQSDRLNAIINDLLLLAQVEQQGEKGLIHTERAPLRTAIDAAVSLCSHKAEARDINITISCAADVFAQINAPLLEQALVNLIDNAIKYSNQGTGVEVIGRGVENGIELVVSDHGPGIPSEHISRLFERFYRVDKGRSREMGGTGLGLSIVKHIVQAHQGSVTVESKLGHGSAFTIFIPS